MLLFNYLDTLPKLYQITIRRIYFEEGAIITIKNPYFGYTTFPLAVYGSKYDQVKCLRTLYFDTLDLSVAED